MPHSPLVRARIAFAIAAAILIAGWLAFRADPGVPPPEQARTAPVAVGSKARDASVARAITVGLRTGNTIATVPKAPASVTNAPAKLPKFRQRQVLVQFKDDASAADRTATRASVGATSHEPVNGNLELLHLAHGRSVADAVKALEQAPAVDFAQRNNVYQTFAAPNDPLFSAQWWLDSPYDVDIDAPEGWAATDPTATAPVPVAVVDSGVDLEHPDLASQIWTNPGENGTAANGSARKSNGVDDDGNGLIDDWRGWDFASNDNDPSPSASHGTHVAGIIAAQRGNGVGVAGVSSQAKIMSAQAFGPAGATDASIIGAVAYAIAKGAKVVNGSYGTVDPNPPANPAMESLISGATGVTFVFAAGNDGQSLASRTVYPCETPSSNVICVGASTSTDTLASFSNYSPTEVDLVAPGVGIRSTLPGGYGDLSGTSMATPVVAGAAAILRSANPTWTPQQIKTRLMATTDPLVTPGASASGRLNLAQAISGTVPPVTATSRATVANGRLIYYADDGASNRVTVAGSGSTYTVEDPASNLTPSAANSGCTQVNVHKLSCAGVTAVTVSSGDLGDRIDTTQVSLPVTVLAGTGVADVKSGSGNDNITTDALADAIDSGAGNDIIKSGAGDDVLKGGDGDDTIIAGPGIDDVNGLAGNDILRGGDGDDSILGGQGTDQLYGEAGADALNSGGQATATETVDGGDGDDAIYDGKSNDNFVGGAGQDLLSYANAGRSVTVALGTSGNGAPGESDAIAADIEDLQGSSRDDVLKGNDGPNWINGAGGTDTIQGLGGDDLLDERYDAYNDDDLSGGTGTDRVWYLRPNGVTASLDGVANDGAANLGEADFIHSDVEGLEGGDGDDVLIGNSGPNVLAGGTGNDELRGGGGVDTYVGGLLSTREDILYYPCFSCGDAEGDAVSYADKTTAVNASLDGVANDGVAGETENIPTDVEKIIGGSGSDTLKSGSYASTLQGGPGADVLVGGPAADTIGARNGVADSITCGGGADAVRADTIDVVPTDCESKDTTVSVGITGGVREGGATNDSTPEFTFSAPYTSGVTYQCKLEPGTAPGAAPFAACASPWSPNTAVPDGAAVFSVRAVAGGVTTTPAVRKFTVDTVVPDTSISDKPFAVSADVDASFRFGPYEASFQCRLDGAAWKKCTLLVSFYGLTSGAHTLDVRAYDAAGNIDATPASYTWTVNPTVVDTEVTSGPATDLYVNADTVGQAYWEVRGTPSTSTFECSAGTDSSAPWTACDGTLFGGWDVPEGTQLFRLRAKSPAGVVDPTPIERKVTYDYTAPDTQFDSGPADGSVVTTTSATFGFSAPAETTTTTFECRLDGAAWAACASTKALSGLAPGPHTFDVRVTDRAGNVDPTPATRTFNVVQVDPWTATPATNSFTPSPALKDWVHWGSSASVTALDRRNVTPSLLGTLAAFGGAAVSINATPVYSWTDAAGTATGSSTWGVGTGGANGKALKFTAASSPTETRTLKIYVGVRGNGVLGALDIGFGAGTKAPAGIPVPGSSDTAISTRVYTVKYLGGPTGDPLSVSWRQSIGGAAAGAAVILYGATVS